MSRRYRMLCPIARALDHVGDRWTLLILRDLHAGPMRFGDIQSGLPGLASNLLAGRLDQLQTSDLIVRDGNEYSLTDLGRRTNRVLWELAQLGMGFPADPDLKRPGHLRFVAVTLEAAMNRVADSELNLLVELVLDDEPLTVAIDEGNVTVRYGAPDDADVVAHSEYEPMMLAAGGELSLATFRRDHVTLEGRRPAVKAFRDLMTRVMSEGFDADPHA